MLVLGGCALLTSLIGCGLDDFEQTLTDEASIPARVAGGGKVDLRYGGRFGNLNLSKSESFSNKGVDPKDVDAIFVKSARIEGIKPPAPAQPRLDLLLESVELWVEAPDQTRKVVASGRQFPPNSYVVDLEVSSDFNLKDYATAPSMTIGTNVILKTQPALDTTLRTTVTLLIDVNLPVL